MNAPISPTTMRVLLPHLSLDSIAAAQNPSPYAVDPPRYETTAEMPEYASGDAQTPLGVLGGNARAQFSATWQIQRRTGE